MYEGSTGIAKHKKREGGRDSQERHRGKQIRINPGSFLF